MQWLDVSHLQAAVVCLVVCAALGSFVPGLIGRVPEPEPEPVAVPHAGASDEGRAQMAAPPPKERYADIAARPGLSARTALAGALSGLCLGAGTGWTGALIYLVPLVPIAIALAVIDWRTTLLPTAIIAPTYALMVSLILVAALVDQDRDSLVRAALGWVALGGAFVILWFVHPAGMGYGDVRLSGVLGLALGYLGWPELVVGAYAAFLIGGVGGGLLAALKLVQRKRFPFGPFMLFGALIGVATGPAIMSGLGY